MSKLDHPQAFGDYELLRRIGAGGMGEVFLARRHGAPPGQVRVIKKVLPHLSEDQGFVGRFVDEGKVVIHLRHPNICQTLEMGEVDGQFFMAMEYVEGKTLAKVESRLRELGYSFPVDLGLWVGAQVCAGLAYAHDEVDPQGRPLQVVHRDISPSNVMLTYDGAVKIIDFGAAISTLKEELTAPRVVIGNLSYMAPEHARKQHVDRRADVFSTGVVLWELFSWQAISSEGDPIERWKRAARPSFEPLSVFRSDLPAELEALVTRALKPDARARFADSAELGAALSRVLAQTSLGTDGKKLGAFMRSLFAAELAAERQIVAEVMGTSGPVTAPVSDPFSSPEPVLSDPLPQALPIDVTLPAMHALRPEQFDPAGQATSPGGPPIDLDGLERTLPGEQLPAELRRQLLEPRPSGRRVERTPTKMRRPVPSVVWAAVGVLIGVAAIALGVGIFR